MASQTVMRSGLARLWNLFHQPDPTPERISGIERRCDQILEQLQTLQADVSRLSLRESQLRAVLQADAQLEAEDSALTRILASEATADHVARAVQRVKVIESPFPYAVIDNVLPKELYAALLKGLPPLEVFADRPMNKRQLVVPFALAPVYSRRVWRYMTSLVVPDLLLPALVDKFRPSLDRWIEANWPTVPPQSIELHSSDGRIILRGRGYRIPPHRDPKWAFVTCILYLARRHDSETWGTQIYEVQDDEEARNVAPHWIDPARCRQVADVSFKPNRMLVFINSVGAHGAQIPEDAPEDTERYIYQFRIAPTVESMALLKSALPDERRPLWAGKAADY